MVVYHKMIQMYHLISLEKIVTEVLDFYKEHQLGRVTKNVTVVTFDFIK